MSNLVEVRDLRVDAKTDSGRNVEIIRGVTFDIAEGEIVALIGESGSGKTTIALTLMGYTRPGCRVSGGSVRLAEQAWPVFQSVSAPVSAALKSLTFHKARPPLSIRRIRSWIRSSR